MISLTGAAAVLSLIEARKPVSDNKKEKLDLEKALGISSLIKSLNMPVPKLVIGTEERSSVSATGFHSDALILNGDDIDTDSPERIYNIKREVCRLNRKDPTLFSVVNAANAILLAGSTFCSDQQHTMIVITCFAILFFAQVRLNESDVQAEKFALTNSTKEEKQGALGRFQAKKVEYKRMRAEDVLGIEDSVNRLTNMPDVAESVREAVFWVAQLLVKDDGDFIWDPYFGEALSTKIDRVETMLASGQN